MNNETYFITGASSDIGQATIRELAKPGTRFIAHYHTSKEALIKLGASLGVEVIPLAADLSKEEEVIRLWQEVQRLGPCPTGFVHLAATRVAQVRFKDLKWEEVQQDFNVQFKSAFLLLSKMLPEMTKRKSGKVVLMLSSYVMGNPPSAMAHYTSVKYALLGLMRSLSAEYGAKNVHINAVSPSMVETRFLENIPELVKEMTASQHPLKRNATPEDVAPVISFLLSPASDFIFGTNIPVTGGGVS